MRNLKYLLGLALAAVIFAAPIAYTQSFQIEDPTIIKKLRTSGGTPPTVGTCGTTPALAAGSNDIAGAVVNTDATACTVTFGTAYAVAPFCVVMNTTAVRAAQTTVVSTTTLVVGALTAGDDFTYICLAKPQG